MAADSVMPRKYYVYALIDPRTETLYYVGLTVDLMNRLSSHKNNGRYAYDKSSVVARRNKEIMQAGYEPQMIILDELTTIHQKIALRLEACWRVEMIRQNEALTNTWDTGLCVDHNNPMGEAQLIRSYAMASAEDLEHLKELDIQRAFKMLFR